jgi:hypothetical protein
MKKEKQKIKPRSAREIYLEEESANARTRLKTTLEEVGRLRMVRDSMQLSLEHERADLETQIAHLKVRLRMVDMRLRGLSVQVGPGQGFNKSGQEL